MLKKVWEALLLVVVLIVMVNIAVAAVSPYLPVIGFVIVAAFAFIVFRIVVSKRKFW